MDDKIRYAELFLRFKCHYGFQVTFCNPNSGNEKGNVENKVGYTRRNFFVPMPSFDDVETFNRELLERCEADWQREHYKKGQSIAGLFDEEKVKFLYLPGKPFNVERYEQHKADGYGKVCVDGKHYYSSSPEHAYNEMVIGISAHHVAVYDKQGTAISRHERSFGETRTDCTDYTTTIERLIRNTNAWSNSGVREILPDEVRAKLDGMPKDELRAALRILNSSAKEYGFDTALLSLKEAMGRGSLNSFEVRAVCARIAIDGLHALPDKGPDLGAYDKELFGSGGSQ
jgi:hypothetical protein